VSKFLLEGINIEDVLKMLLIILIIYDLDAEECWARIFWIMELILNSMAAGGNFIR